MHWPQTLEDVKRVTEAYQYHYNYQRPHQGRACGNRPPRQVFATLPALLQAAGTIATLVNALTEAALLRLSTWKIGGERGMVQEMGIR